ncbi:MAG: hypothetical protein ACE5JU_06635 [Candidatus Binatia bacterium]
MSAAAWCLLAFLAVIIPQTSSAKVLFADDFESSGWTYAKAGWDRYIRFGSDGSGNVTTTNPFAGTNSFQADWVANKTIAVWLEKHFSNLIDVYVRFYVFWSPGYQWTPGRTQGKKVLRTFGEKDIIFKVRGRERSDASHVGNKFRIYSDAGYAIGHQFNYEENLGLKTNVESGKWYCIEIHIKKGQGKGIIEWWINDQKKAEYLNAWTGSKPIKKIRIGGNSSPSKPGRDQTEWYDEVVMSDSRIGCLPDTPAHTPHTAPTRLRGPK